MNRGAAEAQSSSPPVVSTRIRLTKWDVYCFLFIWYNPPPFATPSGASPTCTQMRSCQPTKWLDTVDPPVNIPSLKVFDCCVQRVRAS